MWEVSAVAAICRVKRGSTCGIFPSHCQRVLSSAPSALSLSVCGERLILLGLEEDWRSQKSAFECACGAQLNLTNRIDKPPVDIRQLLNSSIKAPNQ